MEIFSSLHLTGRRVALLALGCVIAVVAAVAFVSAKADVYEEDAVVFLGQFLGADAAENTFAVEQQAADFEVALTLPEVLEQTATVAGISPDAVRAGLESERDLVGTSVNVRFEHEDPEVARDVVTTAPRIALQTLAEQQLSVAEAKEEAERTAVDEAEQELLQFRAETGTFDLEEEVVTRSAELREIELERARAASADTDVRSGLVTELNRLYEQRSLEYEDLFGKVPQYQSLVRNLDDAQVRYDEARNSRARAEARSAGASESAVIVDDVTSPVPRTSEYVRAALSALIAVIALGLLGFALVEVLNTRRRGVTRPAPTPAAAAATVEPAPGFTMAAAPFGDELVDTAEGADTLLFPATSFEDVGGRRRTPSSAPRRGSYADIVSSDWIEDVDAGRSDTGEKLGAGRSDQTDNGAARRPAQARPRRRAPAPSPADAGGVAEPNDDVDTDRAVTSDIGGRGAEPGEDVDAGHSDTGAPPRADQTENGAARRPSQPRPRRRTPTSSSPQ